MKLEIKISYKVIAETYIAYAVLEGEGTLGECIDLVVSNIHENYPRFTVIKIETQWVVTEND